MKKIFLPILLFLFAFISLELLPQQRAQAQEQITTTRTGSFQGKYKRKFDGTGPEGMGPRTGRGMGPCKGQGQQTHFTYFTGIGCPHCASVDPVLLKEKVRSKDILVIEYEIYQQRQNAPLLMTYNDKYKTGLGVPILIAEDCSKDKSVVGAVGSKQIFEMLDQSILSNQGNNVVLTDKVISFEDWDVSKIEGLPNLWYKDRIAMKKDIDSTETIAIKDFLLKGTMPASASVSDIKGVPLSGDKVNIRRQLS